MSGGVWPSASGETTTEKLNIPVWRFAYQKPETFLYREKNLPVERISSQELQQWRDVYPARKARYEEMLAERDLSPSELAHTQEDFSPRQSQGTALGTVCHRVLQHLLTPQAVETQKVINQVVKTAGVGVPVEEVTALILPFVQSDSFSQLKQMDCLARELPFSFVTSGRDVQSGVMDAVLRQADGTIWIVDYKTDQIPPGGTGELLEKYRPQLEIYAQAAKKLFHTQRVRCSAIFIRTFAICDL